MKNIKQIAIIGTTASGKTSLAIKIAQKIDAHILSLDSLSIYKEIDIVSAKPSKEEQKDIIHFGIDHIYPNEKFNVKLFIDLYIQVYSRCKQEDKNLVIVGGTGFYLKMLLDGISPMPNISLKTKHESKLYLQDLPTTYKWLKDLDEEYMSRIKPTDTYRIEKALNIYLETDTTPSLYFKQNPTTSIIKGDINIYQIVWSREAIRERIGTRTELMLESGLIDEVSYLEKKYGQKPNCMKSIGIKETLDYINGVYDRKMLFEKIKTNTSRLAKRQTTFNNSQFDNIFRGSVEECYHKIVEEF